MNSGDFPNMTDEELKPDNNNQRPGSVLFVCGMNAIRSPMAEFIVKDIYGHEIFAQSAGVHGGDPDGFMIAVMEERGIDMSGHVPSALEDLDDLYYDLIVTLTPEAQERTREFTQGQSVQIEHWPIPDPSTTTGKRDGVIQAYRDIRDNLEQRIRERFK